MRWLLLKAGAAGLLTVWVLWAVGDWFYPSDRVNWETEARAMCQAWAGLPAVQDQLPGDMASPDGPDTWSRPCGQGLRVRSGEHRFEALLASGQGPERMLATATPHWPDEGPGEQLYWWTSLAVAWAVSMALIRPLVRRTRELEAVAVAVAAGDLDARPTAQGPAELQSLARALITMTDRLATHIRARQVMLRAVAHELGQPITRMRFGLALLEDAEDPTARERQHLRLGTALDRLEQLSEGVAQQLQLEAAEHRSARSTVALDVLVREVVSAAEPGGLALTVDATPIRVDAHPELVRIAVGNLLANALRLCEGRVRVTVGPAGIAVEDDGPGVPTDRLDQLLQPFVQGAGAGTHGLGLPIVADVARVHGWDLEVGDSDLGGARLALVFAQEPRVG